MSAPNMSTPLFPSNAATVTPGTGRFEPSVIWVGGAGDVTVMPANGTVAVTFPGMAAGSTVPVLAIQVTAATATNLRRIF